MPVSSRRLSLSRAPAQPVDKRDNILRAATAVFARHGFFQAQVADVARAAGVAAGTVYLYFRSKDDLLVSIFDRTMREAIAEGRAALEGVTDSRERLERIARLHLERLGRDRDLAVVFQVELRQSTKFMERFSSTYLRDYLGMIRETIAAGQHAGTFRRDLNPTR
jgi:TetR/AcrR family transcriptional regulator, fatty acid metabolism regulator protein